MESFGPGVALTSVGHAELHDRVRAVRGALELTLEFLAWASVDEADAAEAEGRLERHRHEFGLLRGQGDGGAPSGAFVSSDEDETHSVAGGVEGSDGVHMDALAEVRGPGLPGRPGPTILCSRIKRTRASVSMGLTKASLLPPTFIVINMCMGRSKVGPLFKFALVLP